MSTRDLSPQKSRIPSLVEMRCISPTNTTLKIDENSEIYQSAMSKLYEAAWKFDRGKNGDLLKVLILHDKL
jgi:hypothetical protein